MKHKIIFSRLKPIPRWITHDAQLAHSLHKRLTKTKLLDIPEFEEVKHYAPYLMRLYQNILAKSEQHSSGVIQRLYYDLSHLALFKTLPTNIIEGNTMLNVGIGSWHEQLASRLTFSNVETFIGYDICPKVMQKSQSWLKIYQGALNIDPKTDSYKLHYNSIDPNDRSALSDKHIEYSKPPLNNSFSLITWMHPHPYHWFRRNWGREYSLDILIPFIKTIASRLTDSGIFLATLDEQYWGRNASAENTYHGFENFVHQADYAGLSVSMVNFPHFNGQ